MNPKLILISIFIIIPLNLWSQNKLHNGGFELGSYDCSKWGYYNYDNGIQDWDSDANIPSSGSTYHSPDWYNSSCYNWYDASYLWQRVQAEAYNGTGFCAMYEYELIEQHLTEANELESNRLYLIEFYVYLNELNTQDVFTDHILKLYLSANKMTYETNSYSEECSDNFKTISQSKVKTITQFNLSQYPTNEWLKLSFIYLTPGDVDNTINAYDWFGIELISNNVLDCHEMVVLIDDVSIVDLNRCSEDDCIRTDGISIASDPHRLASPNSPIIVDQLDNIEYAEDIVITNILGAETRHLPDVYSVNGIFNPICWDGKTDGGAHFTNGDFNLWTMNLTNECGTFPYSVPFAKTYNVTEPIPTSPGYSVIATPRPCCTSSPDILIDYNLTGNEVIEFIAANSITLQNMSIESDVEDLILHADNSITFSNGFTSQTNAVFEASIISCNLDPIPEEEPFTFKSTSASNDLGVVSNEQETNYESIRIYPNPSTGQYQVSFGKEIPIEIQVLNSQGVQILCNSPNSQNIILDLTSQPSGLYIVSAIFNDNSLYEHVLIKN